MITDDLPVPSQLSAHPQFLLPLRGHEPLLGLLAGGLGLQPGPDLRLLPVNLGLLAEHNGQRVIGIHACSKG